MNETTLEPLLHRIDDLESRQALRDLVSDYCHGFDKRDIRRFLDIWRGPGARLRGPEAS